MLMMFMNRIVLFASIFVVICATKEQTNNVSNGIVSAGEQQYANGQFQDNIAAESIIPSKLKRGAATTSTAGANNENQVQSSQINLGTNSPSGAGVISYSTPNSYQQFYSPNFAAFSPIYAAAPAAAATPQIWYVRAPQQIVQPSGVGTLKLTYTTNQAQPQQSIQYAATQPKVSYAAAPQQQTAAYPAQYQLAIASQPSPAISYAPALTLPYTTNPYTTATYTNGATAAVAAAPVAAASLQQGQIIPYTAGTTNGINSIVLTPSQLQQLQNLQQYTFSAPTTTAPAAAAAAATYHHIPAAYTTALPILSKFGSTVVTPTAAAYYSAAPASQAYQQQPSFISAIHGGQQYQYANAQKLVALPAYHHPQSQAYKTIVAPTTSTAASSYTAAYVQPTAISPVKYIPQTQQHYYGSASTAYTQKLAAYAPSNFVAASAPTPQAYLSSYHQQQPNTNNNQAFSVSHLPQASNTNTAIHFGSQQLYSPATFGKYSYTQIAAPQKYFYASQ